VNKKVDPRANPYRLDPRDGLAASGVGLVGLGIYVRTLAPGLLYSDSSEFQTLAYTLGASHPSGYPVYLFLAKLFTFLPIQNVAWRVNLFSAIMGALTLAGIYLLVRQLTRSRLGALLGSVMLGIGYTFWSQSIIAEVYSTTWFVITAVLLLMWSWHSDPAKRNKTLFLACLGIGLSIHITIELVIPALVIFVFWNLAALRLPASQWIKTILWAVAGAGLGAGIFLLAFFILIWHNPPTSYIQVTLIPSRSAWGISLAELASPWKVFLATAFSLQWQRSFFSGDLPFMLAQFKQYLKWMFNNDLAPWVCAFAIPGILVALKRRPRWAGFLLLYGAVLLFSIINYEGPGKFVFYPTTYILIAIAAGSGIGMTLDWFRKILGSFSAGRFLLLYPLLAFLLAVLVAGPYWESRSLAIRSGIAQFVQDENTYPAYNLKEPQELAEQRLSHVADDAVFLLDWKTLYATFYTAVVEQKRMGIKIFEDCVNRDDQRLADSLIQDITQALRTGHPVYSDRPYPYLESIFTFEPVPGTDLVRISLIEK
jgi:hypothetical protein